MTCKTCWVVKKSSFAFTIDSNQFWQVALFHHRLLFCHYKCNVAWIGLRLRLDCLLMLDKIALVVQQTKACNCAAVCLALMLRMAMKFQLRISDCRDNRKIICCICSAMHWSKSLHWSIFQAKRTLDAALLRHNQFSESSISREMKVVSSLWVRRTH